MNYIILLGLDFVQNVYLCNKLEKNPNTPTPAG